MSTDEISSSCEWDNFKRILVSLEDKETVEPDVADRLYSQLESVMSLAERKDAFQRFSHECINAVAGAVRKLQNVPRLHIKGFIALHALMTKKTLAASKVARDAASQQRDQHSYFERQVIIIRTFLK
jgi:hypothetical protein